MCFGHDASSCVAALICRASSPLLHHLCLTVAWPDTAASTATAAASVCAIDRAEYAKLCTCHRRRSAPGRPPCSCRPAARAPAPGCWWSCPCRAAPDGSTLKAVSTLCGTRDGVMQRSRVGGRLPAQHAGPSKCLSRRLQMGHRRDQHTGLGGTTAPLLLCQAACTRSVQGCAGC